MVSPSVADLGTISAADLEVEALVVGSGVSGSSLAFSLLQKGVDVLMTESRDTVGGNVISKQQNGYVWEEGPNTFQPAPHILRLAVDLGLKDDLVLADHTLPRFVFWDDDLYALPLGPKDIPNFKLLSPWGFIRAGLGALGFVLPNFSGKEESVKDFISRHLGREVFEKMIDPFVSGVYAGDPSRLAMSAAFKKIKALEDLGLTQGIIEGAIIRIAQKKQEAGEVDPELPVYKGGSLGSFRHGLGMLPTAVASKLGDSRVRLQWKLITVRKSQSGAYDAIFDTPMGRQVVRAKTIGMTAPAGPTASALGEIMPRAQLLNNIYYPCVFSVTMAYPNEAFKKPLRGFGNLIPRSMGVRTLGTIWSSCLFPGRAPEGMTLLLSYIGGAQDKGIVDLSEEEVADQVDKDIRRILLRDDWTGQPTVVGVRKWPRAIPQYNQGHLGTLDIVAEDVAKHPGLFLGGNYVAGVAFGDCVQWGVDTAEAVNEYVQMHSK